MSLPCTIERVDLHLVSMPMIHPIETSFAREHIRPCVLVSVHSGELVGWGECVAGSGPWYSGETTETAWHMLRDFLIPALLGQAVQQPAEVVQAFARVRGNQMARAALETAVWDLLAQAQGLSLAALLHRQQATPGNPAERVPVGVSIGIEPTLAELLDQVAQFVDAGYRRVKLKIKPGWDVAVVQAVRERWPDLLVQVDANSAYTLADSAVFRELDQFGLLLIEQPLHYEDIVDHARLQQQIETPICLDESIHGAEHARWALDLHACRIINIKVGRVGGLSAALTVHDLCAARDVPVWCGGMMETNIGRAGNVALASLPNFQLPGDISASARYFKQDIAAPNFTLNADSTLSVPQAPGLGVAVDAEQLAAVRTRHSSATA
jgi:O-succinylbenzoate synthase